MQRMTREQMADRRRQMADMIRSGKTVEVVVRKFGVSLQTVRNACAEYGVRLSVDTSARAAGSK